MDAATALDLESWDVGSDAVSASDWVKGITLSVLASLVGGASKLIIRKSWLIEEEIKEYYSENPTDAGDGDGEGDSESDSGMPEPLTLNSLDHTGNDDDSVPSISPVLSPRKKWSKWAPGCMRCSGMLGMTVLNPTFCVLAMNYASPSILAPFSGLTLVWVILFSRPVVGETPSSPQVLAASFIVAGEVIVAIFGDHTNDVGVTVDEVRLSYKDPFFITYFVVLGLYLAVLTYWILYTKSPVLRRFAWGTCGGSITGMQNFLKDFLTIIKATAKDDHYPWFFWLFLFLAAATAFGGLLILTACMKRYDATYSAASFVGAFVVSASIMSATHYKTFVFLDSLWSYIFYPTGLLVLMIGVYILVKGSDDADEEDVIQPRAPVRKNSEDSELHFAYTKVEDEPGDARNEQVV